MNSQDKCAGCGHLEVHHVALLSATLDQTCRWIGCGCPWYVAYETEQVCNVIKNVAGAWNTGNVFCSKHKDHVGEHKGNFDGDVFRWS